MPGNDANTKLLLHANGGDGVKSAFAHVKCNDNAASTSVTDDGTGANAFTASTNTSNLNVAGKISSAFDFNGTTEYLILDSLAADIASDQVGSVSFWFYADASTGHMFTIGDASANQFVFIEFVGARNINVEVQGQLAVDTDNAFSLSAWHHVVVVQDGTGIKIYVDGNDEALTYTLSTDIGAWCGDQTGLDTGRVACSNFNGAGNAAFFDGAIDDLRYYKCALSSTEVATLYNSGSGTENSIILDASVGGHTEVQTYGDARLDPGAFCHMAMEDNTDTGYGFNAVTDIGTPTYTAGKLNNALTLDGSTDALALDALAADIASDTVGSIAFWVNATNPTTTEFIMSFADTSALPYFTLGTTSNNDFSIWLNNGTINMWGGTSANGTLPDTTWVHCVLVQDGVSPKLYLNGSETSFLSTTTDTTGWFSDLSGMDNGRIGCVRFNGGSNQTFFAGKIDDFRYYKYPLKQKEIDAIYNSGTGTEDNVSLAKWNTNSLAFDGTGDYVEAPDSADWDIYASNTADYTVDLQVYHNTTGADEYYIGQREDGTNRWWFKKSTSDIVQFYMRSNSGNQVVMDSLESLTANEWHHLCMVKNGQWQGLYIDGVQQAFDWNVDEDTFSGNLVIGYNDGFASVLTGNIDEVRMQADNYFNASPNSFPAAPLLIYGEGVDEATTDTNQGYGDSITFNGTAKLDDAGPPKFNATTSLWFDGNSDYLTVTDTSGTDYDVVGSAADSWTLDAWVKNAAASGNYGYFAQYVDGSNFWRFYTIGTVLYFRSRSGGTQYVNAFGTLSSTAWNHIAMVKSGNHYGVYLNGVQIGYDSNSTTYTLAASLEVGGQPASALWMNGYMEQVQVTKGNKFGVVPMPEPYAHYKMNDNAASTTVTDDGSGANNLTASSNTSNLNATGKINDCFDFAATYSINAWTLGTDIDTDTTGTITFWVNTSDGSETIFAIGSSTTDTHFPIRISSNKLNIFSQNNGPNVLTATGTATVSTGSWVHCAVVQDGTSLKFYVNGEEDAISSSSGDLTAWFADITTSVDVATLGGSQGFFGLGSTNFNGDLDDFRYYQNTALNATQIAQIYNSASGSELTYPIGLTVPTAVLTQDTITEPTAEYSPPDVTVTPSTLTMSVTLNDPTEVLKYDNPSSLAALLTLNAPQTGPTVFPTTQALALTLESPTTEVLTPNPTILSLTATANAPDPTVTFLDSTQSLSLTLNTPASGLYSTPATVAGLISIHAPLPIVTAEPTTVPITLTLEDSQAEPTATPTTIEGTLGILGPGIEAITTATTLNLSLTLNAPTPVTTHNVGVGIGGALPLTISAGFSPTIGSIQPEIVRYIKDPIVTGGCPQCGTFAYTKGGREVSGEVVKRGRNYDIDKGRREDRYIRCGRCGFILHKDRHIAIKDGSRAGWGMKYTEIEAGEES